MNKEEKSIKNELLFWAKKLYERHLVCGNSGNVSARLDKERILISARGAYLGFLEDKDVLLIDSKGACLEGDRDTSIETPIHLAIYKRFTASLIIHAHPNFANAYFAKFDRLDFPTLENKIYLGNIPVVAQETPRVTDLDSVLDALERSNIVVLKNHGVLSIGDDFKQVFSYIEYLEELAKVNLLTKPSPDKKQVPVSRDTAFRDTRKYKMFSRQHIEAIVKLVNENEDIARLGKQLAMTMNLAIKLDETGQVYNFHFVDGLIQETTGSEEDAEFIISGSEKHWRMIFNRQLDPFVATTQKKLKLTGDFGKISRWYVPCSKIFELWQQVSIEQD